MVFLCLSQISLGQIPSYYKEIDFNSSKAQLQNSLNLLLTKTHEHKLTYTPGVWEAIKVLDNNPVDNSQVLLIYGYNDEDNDLINDRSRAKYLTCHESKCTGKWNREHIYPKSIGEFDEDEYAYTDVHAIRASDTEMNSLRFNSPFVDGDGNAQEIYNYRFYPGDEWKGDVARMIMYMYLRYPNTCKPNYVGIDSHKYSAEIPDIFLEWNVEDPVSDFEIRRNNLIASKFQGNRNPFIDNPYIATMLWGGPKAQDLWNSLSTNHWEYETMEIYPNPTQDVVYYDKNDWTAIKIYDEMGRLLGVDNNLQDNKTILPKRNAVYYIEFCKVNSCKSYPIVKN